MYDLKITELAQSDLDEIVKYFAVQLDSPAEAGIFLDEIERCYSFLRESPFIYAKSGDLRLQTEGYRKAPVKNYVIMNKVNEEENSVVIYRIFYGAQDYYKLL